MMREECHRAVKIKRKAIEAQSRSAVQDTRLHSPLDLSQKMAQDMMLCVYGRTLGGY